MSMSNQNVGCQSINCGVCSCRHHMQDDTCKLQSIQVEPMCGCNSGEPCDESLCGSYQAK